MATQPHVITEEGLCSRCQHRWPCPSAVAGEDLPESTGCMPDGNVLPEGLQARVELVTWGLVVDSGKRRRVNGRLPILWTLSKEGRDLAPQLVAGVRQQDDPPSEEEMRRVLRWLEDNQPVHGTRRLVAERCAQALGWSPARVERCLIWADANGLVTCRETA